MSHTRSNSVPSGEARLEFLLKVQTLVIEGGGQVHLMERGVDLDRDILQMSLPCGLRLKLVVDASKLAHSAVSLYGQLPPDTSANVAAAVTGFKLSPVDGEVPIESPTSLEGAVYFLQRLLDIDACGAMFEGSDTPMCYVVNLSHHKRQHRYVTVWRPGNRGYAWPLAWAGKYPQVMAEKSLDYYNTGENFVVPCSVLDALAVPPEPGQIDGDVGPVVRSNKKNWDTILASVIVQPKAIPVPVYRGAPDKSKFAYSKARPLA